MEACRWGVLKAPIAVVDQVTVRRRRDSDQSQVITIRVHIVGQDVVDGHALPLERGGNVIHRNGPRIRGYHAQGHGGNGRGLRAVIQPVGKRVRPGKSGFGLIDHYLIGV